jgi:hypothetical protein
MMNKINILRIEKHKKKSSLHDIDHLLYIKALLLY